MTRVRVVDARLGSAGHLGFAHLARLIAQRAPDSEADLVLGSGGPEVTTWVRPRSTGRGRALAQQLHDAAVHELGLPDGGIWEAEAESLSATELSVRLDLPGSAAGSGAAAAADALGQAIARFVRRSAGFSEPPGLEDARTLRATGVPTVRTVREERDQEVEIWHEVPLVPQVTGMSCWAAAAAMLVGWRECTPVDPEALARGAGRWHEYQIGLLPDDLDTLCKTWDLVSEAPARVTPERLIDLLERHGPLWTGEADPGLHVIVITGLHGDGSLDRTWLHIADPWPVGRGERYTLSFSEFVENFGSARALAGVPTRILYSRLTGGPRRVSYRRSEQRVVRSAG